ncbi:MAG: hypothetical protein ABL907_14830 [Hyphomicrobium sp.]
MARFANMDEDAPVTVDANRATEQGFDTPAGKTPTIIIVSLFSIEINKYRYLPFAWRIARYSARRIWLAHRSAQ